MPDGCALATVSDQDVMVAAEESGVIREIYVDRGDRVTEGQPIAKIDDRVLSAQEALEWGLVNRVVPAADLMSEVTRLATELAKGPTCAYGGVKKLVLMSPNDTLESQMELETRVIAEMAGTKDARAGISAFVAKEKPVFTGE